MKKLGYILIGLAFLSCAFLASLDPRIIDWTQFLPALALGALGVVIVKRDARVEAKDESKLATNRALLGTSLANIIDNLKAVNARKDDIPTFEMRFEIDRLFRDDLDNFAEARHSLQHLFSLQKYAEIMSAFAAGERYINRVWSASADGYVDEVMKYLTRAETQFEEAKAKFDAANVAH